MTKEENKKLLLKDLSCRLPYGVKVVVPSLSDKVYTLKGIRIEDNMVVCELECKGIVFMPIECVKPCLFPLSSIDKWLIYAFYCQFVENDISFDDFLSDYWNTNSFHKVLTSIDDCRLVVDFFNINHCDYNNLIEKGLSNDATNLNIY